MSIPGFATEEKTAQFARKFTSHFAKDAYRRLGRTGLIASKLGFGTYRCTQESDVHRQALQLALRKGCNIIDTSANYMDGAAEALIGEVLNQEIVWGELQRESVILVSKVGYIQGTNLEIARKLEQDNRPFPEVVKLQPDLWHCIHPLFIQDQLTRSLSRMHIDCLDVYLLHNPEYFLYAVRTSGKGNRQQEEEEFYGRIRRAFLQMEKFVSDGLIRYYGISSNGFSLSPKESEFVNLNKVWAAYEAACDELGISTEEGHFAIIQLPYNWIEHQAFTLKNLSFRGKPLSVLELAKQLNLGVLVNRPLNAVRNHRLIPLRRMPEGSFIEEEERLRNRLAKVFDAHFPDFKHLTFSQKALWIASSTPGVDVTLNGMRRPEYVEDSLKLMELSAIEISGDLFNFIQ